MAQAGHTLVEMVRRYIRSGQLFEENAVDNPGLKALARPEYRWA
jgi:hypothetical protein